MPKRYCITYIGDDSYTHTATVWAKDHRAALQKFKSRYGDVDGISSVHRMSNLKIYIWAIILGGAALYVAYTLR